MSNRSFAARYNGAPDVRSSGGGSGADLFGMQFNRQKQLLALQQQMELERQQKAHEQAMEEDTHASELKKGEGSFSAAVDILKAQGIIPNEKNIKSYDDATTQERVAIAQTENAIEQTQKTSTLNTLQSKPGQQALNQNTMDVLAKPGLENNTEMAKARAMSAIAAPANTGVNYWPTGKPGQSVTAQGGTQTTQLVGGIKDPKTGQIIGGRPVETYGNARFPVDKIDMSGGTDALINPNNPSVQAKPSAADFFGMNFASGNTAPPTNTSSGSDVLTKPQQQPMNPAAGDPMDILKYIIENLKKQNLQGTDLTGGSLTL